MSNSNAAASDKKDYDPTRRYSTARCGTAPFPAALGAQVSSLLEDVDKSSLRWLLDDPRYKSWRDGDTQVLSIIGPAGTGKSTLAASVIRDLQPLVRPQAPSGDIGLAHFIRDDYRLDHVEFVCVTLSAQLGRLSLAAATALEGDGGRSILDDDDDPAEWGEALSRTCKVFDKVYIVLDGLEENPDSDWKLQDMANNFKEIADNEKNIRILFTSEEALDIKGEVVNLGHDDKPNTLQAVKATLSSDGRFKSLPDEVTTKLLSSVADSNFLLAKLQLELFGRRGHSMVGALTLPNTIEKVWEQLIDTYSVEDQKYLRRLLMFMAYTYEPHGFINTEPLGTQRAMNVTELTDFLLTEPEDTKHDTERRRQGIDLRQWDRIFLQITDIPIHDDRGMSLELDNLDVRKDWVSLIHPALKHFIRQWITPKVAHAEITRTLMAYNCFDEFKDDFSGKDEDEEDGSDDVDDDGQEPADWRWKTKDGGYPDYPKYPYQFRRYAALHFTKHAKKAGIPMEERWYTEFFAPDCPKWKSATVYCERGFEGIFEMDRLLHSTQLEVLLRDDVMEFIKRVLRDGIPKYTPNFNSSCAGGVCSLPPDESPLANIKTKEQFELLLNTPGIKLKGALKGAIRVGKDAVQKLLDMGADPNSGLGETLSEAARNGDLEILKMLIDHGADVNIRHKRMNRVDPPLVEAVYSGKRDVAEMLLANGADINLAGGNYYLNTPLTAAVGWGKLEFVDMLLEKGADINLRCAIGSPLHTAAELGGEFGGKHSLRTDTVKMLLERGADPSIVHGRNGTVIASTVVRRDKNMEGIREILEILLATPGGKSVLNTVAGKYHSAVATAAGVNSKGIVEILQFLKDHGADMNLPRGLPLISAIRTGCIEAVEFLLDCGLDPNGVTDPNLKPQPYYSKRGNLDEIIDGGKILQAIKEFGTPLHLAAATGRKDVVELLLKHGADKDIAGGYYGSAVDAAKRRKRKEILELFDVVEGDDMDIETSEKDKEMMLKMQTWTETRGIDEDEESEPEDDEDGDD